jgi:hypothetical protein
MLLREFGFSLNLRVPNGSSVLTCAIRDFDPIVFTEFLPLRSIGANLDGTAVAALPDVYDPLFVIGRSLVFDFPCFTAAT